MWQQILSDVIRKTLAAFGERIAAFGPNLLAALLILAVGAPLAIVLRWIVRVSLRRLGFDRLAQRSGIAVVLQKGGISAVPSAVVANALGWLAFGVFVLLAIGALDLAVAMQLISQTFAYVPQLLIAAAILVLGALVAGFVRRSVLVAAVNAELTSARFLAGATQTALMVVFSAMALEHLGLGRQVILIAFAILFGGVVLALALAFGLAGRDLAREALGRALRSGTEAGPVDPRRQL
jgi:hypothetical protein